MKNLLTPIPDGHYELKFFAENEERDIFTSPTSLRPSHAVTEVEMTRYVQSDNAIWPFPYRMATDRQSGSAYVPFHVAPFDVPLVSDELTLDGKCDDSGYGELDLPLISHDASDTTTAALVRTEDYLWACLQGLQDGGSYTGVQIDIDNSQEESVQTDDRGFFVRRNGTLAPNGGDGDKFVPIPLDGMTAHVSSNEGTWSAELRIDADVLGGWNRRIALGIGQYLGSLDGEEIVWPRSAQVANPQSWAQVNLGADQSQNLIELSPHSGVVGNSTSLTVTGSGYNEDTVILWDGNPLATTYIDDSTLQTTIDAGQIDAAGTYQVPAAPGDAPLLATIPLRFVALNEQTAISRLSPDSAAIGGAGFTLVVDGSGFVAGATVLWNGEARLTTFVNNVSSG